AREAGLIPNSIPPGSLLTVFHGGDGVSHWEPSHGGAAAAIHRSVSLVEKRPPPGGAEEPGPLCVLTPDIVEGFPSWPEMFAILQRELGDPDPEALAAFEREHWPEYAEAREATRVGGWPYWLQSPIEYGIFLAQITSEEESELMFGDCGSLYLILN